MAALQELPPAVLKNLVDRSFENRKKGAQEVEKIMRRMRDEAGPEAIRRLLAGLASDYACSLNSNFRKGGLIGLASCAIGLVGVISEHLDLVVPPVLKNFSDQESRVRYYACESLYNICKISRGAMLPYLSDIFVATCRIVADVDVEVKNAAALFDRLLKEVVTEAAASSPLPAPGGGGAPPAAASRGPEVARRVVPLLRSHMSVVNPYVRQMLVGWISSLDSVPGVEMLDHLGELLQGLFDMLSDGNREVRQSAHMALAGLLSQIDRLPPEGFSARLNLRVVIPVLLAQMGRDKQKFTRVTAVDWVSRCIGLGRTRLAPWYPLLAGALLGDLADTDGELVRDLAKANTDLMLLVRATTRAELDAEEFAPPLLPPGEGAAEGSGGGGGGGGGAAAAPPPAPPGKRGSAVQGLLCAVRANLCAPDHLTRSAALRWLSMLLLQLPDAVVAETDSLLSTLLSNLTDTADPEVLKLNLEVLARLATTDPTWALLRKRILVGLVALFGEQRGLLEAKAAFIVRRLCLLLDPRVVYLGLAEILHAEGNKEFTALLVELLNLILLTSAELSDFRDSLRGCAARGGEGAAVFTALFRTWVVNPIASVSLCLLAHAHSLASRLVVRVHDMQVTVGLLMQLDKLVQLLESPVFLDVRLGLLSPRSGECQALLSTLYGLLMILPQGTAYATLKDRLTAVGNLHVAQGLLGGAGAGVGGGAGAGAEPLPSPIDVDAAEAIFAESQAHFRSALSLEIKARSVVGAPAAADTPGGS